MMQEETPNPANPEGMKIRAVGPPIEVPVFNVVIYVSHVEGRVQAEVVNLPDICFTAGSEPMALKQAITEVKSRLAAWHSAGETVPWVDPIRDPESGEQQRLVPVHL